jgi:hypothetical protein
VRLVLRALSADRADFEAFPGSEQQRPVSVFRGTDGQPRFPHLRTEYGLSLGSDALDRLVCERAAEEFARVDAGRLARGAPR